ncbi:tyrosine-type recombinase/integrase [filamentous cyanobacterium LEGE 11480]|uniref:Tyrosine-type recombinase/integrase n=1 Tax=Romeriopsis navalis LEGE 11480 TaxID=2777977 RepID=A0A928VTG5_9CYAN|nr:tyrosine-type recombinase/integrase [Romeriopsis navalis]MBE9032741.1 tyrosine-type recombinase/integrase [Romeriopsis navalis LEGE 11480]
MKPIRAVPDPVLIPLQGKQVAQPAVAVPQLRQTRIDEFFQARSLAPNTEKAYRHDLSYFLQWTEQNWADITPRQIAQFKSHLMEKHIDGQRIRSDASVRRILGTLQTFYAWLYRVRYVSDNPTLAIELPKIPEPEARALTAQQVEKIYQAAIALKFPERNMALISLLSHGLRASEASALNVSDFEIEKVYIRASKADSKGYVPIDLDAQMWIQQYLKIREADGEILEGESPLLLSHSPRNAGTRMSYNAIRKLMDKISAQAGFKVTSHQFRHTFGTEMVLSGMNPYHVRTLMRQKSEQTFRRYAKAADYIAAEQAFRQHRK